MLSSVIFGMNIYEYLGCFVIYSMGGWLVESIYMSFCEKKLTNRGFGFGPFCPIYGVGATAGYLLMCPLTDNPLLLYFVAAIGATVFEYIVGILMKKTLGEVWWDYNDKPVNLHGIICLESTLAWGFYGIIVIRFLHLRLLGLIHQIPERIGAPIFIAIIFIYFCDFLYHVLKVFGVVGKKDEETTEDIA